MTLWRTLIDQLFPERCLRCARIGATLCAACLSSIPRLSQQHCPRCETPFSRGWLCAACRSQWPLDGLWVAAPYHHDTLLAQAIQTMKYRHVRGLAETLGAWLAQSFHAEGPRLRDFIVTAVPLHPRRLNERGYNQADALAQVVAPALDLPVQITLQRHRHTPPQARLARKDRLHNVAGAFLEVAPASSLLNKKFILFDDVCSTGATLNACAQALKDGGARQVYGLVLARG